MKKEIHPEYRPSTIVCSCGNRIETRSTQEEIHVEICAVCHPFYTGRQKLVDTAGRVERFKKKYGDTSTGAVPEEEGATGEEESAADDETAADEEAAPAPEAGTAGGPKEAGEAADQQRPRKVAAGAGEGGTGEEDSGGEEDAEAEA